MFKQMGKTALVIPLVQGTSIDSHSQADLARWHIILPNCISYAIGHFPKQPLLIDRNIGAAINPRIIGPCIFGLVRLCRADNAILRQGRQRSCNRKKDNDGEESASGAGKECHDAPIAGQGMKVR